MMKMFCCCFMLFISSMWTFGDTTNTIESAQELELRRRMLFFARLHDLRQVHSDFVGDFIKSNSICVSTAASIAQSLAKETFIKFESGQPGASFSEYSRLLAFVTHYGDKQNLTFLEQASHSTNKHLRVESAYAYIRLADVDSFPFIKAIFSNNNYTGYDREKVLKAFNRMLKSEKGMAKKSSELTRKIHMFYFEILEKESDGGCVSSIDNNLCEEIPDYRNSVQRLACASSFAENGNKYYKDYFGKIRDEIEKTHKEKRKDFKAKGELLDPDRKK